MADPSLMRYMSKRVSDLNVEQLEKEIEIVDKRIKTWEKEAHYYDHCSYCGEMHHLNIWKCIHDDAESHNWCGFCEQAEIMYCIYCGYGFCQKMQSEEEGGAKCKRCTHE